MTYRVIHSEGPEFWATTVSDELVEAENATDAIRATSHYAAHPSPIDELDDGSAGAWDQDAPDGCVSHTIARLHRAIDDLSDSQRPA